MNFRCSSCSIWSHIIVWKPAFFLICSLLKAKWRSLKLACSIKLTCMFNDTIIRYSDVIMLHWYSWSSMLGKQVSYSEFILYSDHYHHHQNQNTGHFRSYSCSEFQWSRQLGTFLLGDYCLWHLVILLSAVTVRQQSRSAGL